ncbi:hypothetical protein [Streptomyces sp. NBC_01343]
MVDQLSPAGAVRALGVTQATVRVRLHRARRALRTPGPVHANRLEAVR